MAETLEKSKLLLDVVGGLLTTEALHLVHERCEHLGVLKLGLPWHLLFKKKLRNHGLYSDLHVRLAEAHLVKLWFRSLNLRIVSIDEVLDYN
jgi:hypothetical protein